MAESMGWATALCIDTASPIDTSSLPLEFLTCDLGELEELIASEGVRGTRSRRGERVHTGLRRVGGSWTMNPSPDELDDLLPFILGAAESLDSFALADTLPDLWACVDKVARVETYNSGKIASAMFEGSTGQKILLTLNALFKTMTIGAAGSYPALTVDSRNCYKFDHGVLTLASTAYEFNSFRLMVDNVIDPEFANSVTATDLTPSDRIVTLEIPEMPFTATELALLTNSRGATAGISGSLVFTNGGVSTTFTMNDLWTPSQTVAIRGRKTRLKLPRQFQAHMTGSTRELVVTHDSVA
jgi:hypothetical protein